jgi:hypothetical protein
MTDRRRDVEPERSEPQFPGVDGGGGVGRLQLPDRGGGQSDSGGVKEFAAIKGIHGVLQR